MKQTLRTVFFASLAVATFGLMAYLFISNDLTLLEPRGIIAGQQKGLLVFAALLSLVVILPVYALTITIALRYRENNKKAKYSPDHDHSRTLETLWWGIPIAIILVLSVITWKTTHSLDPFKPLASEKKPLTIQVVALQWKWLFIYPEQKIATVNYFQIPEDTPIKFQITSDAPMNSFWIPQLGGQIYAMSGMTTELNLMADNPGKYDGYSANISGTGFADMKFVAESSTEQDFSNWVSNKKFSGYVLNQSTYDSLSKPSTEVESSSYVLEKSDMFSSIVNKYMSHGANDETENSYISNHSEHGGDTR